MKERENINNDCREETEAMLRHDEDPIVISLYGPEIVSHIAEMAADELDGIIMDIDDSMASAIIMALDESEPDDMLISLRMLFLVGGKKAMANCLDILEILKESDEEVYERFKDSFLSTDEMDWWLEGVWLDELMKEGGKDVRN